MELLAQLARVEIGLVLGLLLVAVCFQVLTGRIRAAGLFDNKATGTFDPARLQLFALTAFLAGQMLLNLDDMRTSHEITLSSDVLLYALGGSHALYLVQKYFQVHPPSHEE